MYIEFDTNAETAKVQHQVVVRDQDQSLNLVYLDETTLDYVGGGEVTNDY